MQTIEKNLFEMSMSQRMAIMRSAQAELQRNPKNVEAMLAVASVSGVEANLEESLKWLQKALSIRKKDPEILRRLVSAALEAGIFKTARKYARQLASIDSLNPESHQLLAAVMEKSGFPAQAIPSFERAHQLDPGNPDYLAAMAHSNSMSGNAELATHYYEQALAIDPAHARSLYGHSSGRKFSAEEAERHVDAVKQALGRLGNDHEGQKTAARLNFSAGKVLDDARKYDEAFPFFAEGNALNRPTQPVSLWPPFENVEYAFSRELLRSRQGYGLETTKPVFIIGMPRSGTTLTESVCGAHSKVTAADEQQIMPRICVALGRDDLKQPFKDAIERIPPDGAKAIARDYLDKTSEAAGNTPHFTDKLPHNFLNLGLIALVFPNAKIIHVRRHPLDNCLSIFTNQMNNHHNRYKTDLTTLGLYYRRYKKLMDYWHQVLPGKIHDVYYEDLVANTELNARAIVDHLGLDWEDSVLERGQSQRSVKTLSVWQVRQPVYSSSKGRWRNYEEHIGPLVSALGPLVGQYEAELAALSENEDAAANA